MDVSFWCENAKIDGWYNLRKHIQVKENTTCESKLSSSFYGPSKKTQYLFGGLNATKNMSRKPNKKSAKLDQIPSCVSIFALVFLHPDVCLHTLNINLPSIHELTIPLLISACFGVAQSTSGWNVDIHSNMKRRTWGGLCGRSTPSWSWSSPSFLAVCLSPKLYPQCLVENKLPALPPLIVCFLGGFFHLTGTNEWTELWHLCEYVDRHVHTPGPVPEPGEQGAAGEHQTSRSGYPGVTLKSAQKTNAKQKQQKKKSSEEQERVVFCCCNLQ